MLTYAVRMSATARQRMPVTTAQEGRARRLSQSSEGAPHFEIREGEGQVEAVAEVEGGGEAGIGGVLQWWGREGCMLTYADVC
jgi:hypothetical protein